MSGHSDALTVGDATFAWQEQWVDTPNREEADRGWAHHGLARLTDGRIIAFHPDRPDIVIYETSGVCSGSYATGLTEGHGITVVVDDGRERIWIADPGVKMRRDATGDYKAQYGRGGGQVVAFALDGSAVGRLASPPHHAYRSGHYAPTSIAVDERRFGGAGDIWVADGYGESLVHRFSSDGEYEMTIDGSEGPGGRFDCPHGILIDRRRKEPELLIADRGNERLRAYTLNGQWIRDIGVAFLNSPSSLAIWRNRLIVAELRARLAVLDADDQLIGYLGANGEICDVPGWPNSLDYRAHPARQAPLAPGKFNSPHGLVTDEQGNIFIAEWLIGGRMIRLASLDID